MAVEGATLGFSPAGRCKEPRVEWPQLCSGPRLGRIPGSRSPGCARNGSGRAEGLLLPGPSGCRTRRVWPPPSEITRLFWDGG